MPCPVAGCGGVMRVNGSHWECGKCGGLMPIGETQAVPEVTGPDEHV